MRLAVGHADPACSDPFWRDPSLFVDSGHFDPARSLHIARRSRAGDADAATRWSCKKRTCGPRAAGQFSADERNRTSTGVTPQEPESCASASSATSATGAARIATAAEACRTSTGRQAPGAGRWGVRAVGSSGVRALGGDSAAATARCRGPESPRLALQRWNASSRDRSGRLLARRSEGFGPTA